MRSLKSPTDAKKVQSLKNFEKIVPFLTDI